MADPVPTAWDVAEPDVEDWLFEEPPVVEVALGAWVPDPLLPAADPVTVTTVDPPWELPARLDPDPPELDVPPVVGAGVWRLPDAEDDDAAVPDPEPDAACEAGVFHQPYWGMRDGLDGAGREAGWQYQLSIPSHPVSGPAAMSRRCVGWTTPDVA